MCLWRLRVSKWICVAAASGSACAVVFSRASAGSRAPSWLPFLRLSQILSGSTKPYLLLNKSLPPPLPLFYLLPVSLPSQSLFLPHLGSGFTRGVGSLFPLQRPCQEIPPVPASQAQAAALPPLPLPATACPRPDGEDAAVRPVKKNNR